MQAGIPLVFFQGLLSVWKGVSVEAFIIRLGFWGVSMLQLPQHTKPRLQIPS